MKYLLPSIAICAVALMIAACFDPEPAEISVIATKNGMRKGCVVQVFNAKGIQIAEDATDFNGIGYVKDGEALIQDMFGVKPVGMGSHPPDVELGGSDDILDYAGREEGGVTVIELKIPLDSGDEYDKPLSPGAGYDLITAIGSGDDFDSIHIARGRGNITLDG